MYYSTTTKPFSLNRFYLENGNILDRQKVNNTQDLTQSIEIQKAAYEAIAFATDIKTVQRQKGATSDSSVSVTFDPFSDRHLFWWIFMTRPYGPYYGPSFSSSSHISSSGGGGGDCGKAAIIIAIIFIGISAIATLGLAIKQAYNCGSVHSKIQEAEEKNNDPQLDTKIQQIYASALPLLRRKRNDLALKASFTFLIGGGLAVLTAAAIIAFIATNKLSPAPLSSKLMAMAGGSACALGMGAHLVKWMVKKARKETVSQDKKEEAKEVLNKIAVLYRGEDHLLPTLADILQEGRESANTYKVFYPVKERSSTMSDTGFAYYYLDSSHRIAKTNDKKMLSSSGYTELTISKN